MPAYKQADRPLLITTPLGPDQLLVTRFGGQEAISQLFKFEVDLLAENEAEIPFDGIAGQSVTIQMRTAGEETRYFNGLVNRFSQGARDDTFTAYRAEVVPKLWLLTKKIRSRVFQQISVPNILKQVLAGLDVAYDLLGDYYERDYCAQYRESDFDFVSRLMEEEGIYYFFKHSDGHHQMVVSDVANNHPSVSGQSSVIYEELYGGEPGDVRITAWEKTQELRSTKYTVWDHCFELPGRHLDESVGTLDRARAGSVTHKLNLVGDPLEIYEYPGGYAKRYDNVGRGGGARPQDTSHIFEDSHRIVHVRMEEEECGAVEIAGAGDCGNFTAGHKFTLQRHFNGDGDYLLTRVEHAASQSGYRSTEKDEFTYRNRFLCMPVELPYRPRRVTPRPAIAGVQTATVTGPPGEDTSGQEIFCDKYGRVKVQFHWDREGKMDGDSSCWLRVAQAWAGRGWGAFFWPRIGHEVVVAFEDGDPDQPLIVGSVYNADNMPPYQLPAKNHLGGIRSASVRGSAHENYNGIVFNDEKGAEHLALHSERNMSLDSEFDKMFHARNKGERIAGSSVHTVGILPGGSGSGDSGGGSGGGDDESYSTGHTMPAKDEPAALGIKSDTVYGSAQTLTLGFDYGLVFGAKNRVCIDPLGPWSSVRPWASPLLAGALGGQVDFFMGTKTDFVWGPSFSLEVGEEAHRLKRSVTGVPLVRWLAIAFGAVSALWVLVHSALKEDKDRAIFGGICQVVSSALLTAIVISGRYYKEKVEQPADGAHALANRASLIPSARPPLPRPVYEVYSGG